MRNIHHLSWNETSFEAKAQLFAKSLATNREGVRDGYPGSYSALSSTYYNIAGAAFYHLRTMTAPGWRLLLLPLRLLLWFMTWLPLGGWCYWRMLPLSNKVVVVSGGYSRMSADQCDVRQSILRRRGRYEEAMECINAGLVKKTMKSHTRGLLHAGLADVHMHYKQRVDAHVQMTHAIKAAGESEPEEPNHAARIYRLCADVADWLKLDMSEGKRLRQKAVRLLEISGTKDQLIKIDG